MTLTKNSPTPVIPVSKRRRGNRIAHSLGGKRDWIGEAASRKGYEMDVSVISSAQAERSE